MIIATSVMMNDKLAISYEQSAISSNAKHVTDSRLLTAES